MISVTRLHIFYSSRIALELPLTIQNISNAAKVLQNDIEKIATSLQLESHVLTSEETTKIFSMLSLEADIIVKNQLGKSVMVPLSICKKDSSAKTLSANKTWPIRPPVVTIMGHVDHGKTSLLDAFRKTNVAAGEAGGITQHIGAFSVEVPEFPNSSITFLDTPGHAAFTEMRRRGANLTDIAILVIAATDGIMPQTIECIQLVKDAQVPLIIAITKSDLNTNRSSSLLIMKELSRYGVEVEPLGGSTQIVNVSSKTGKGLPDLLAAISALGEQLELRAPGIEAGPSALDAYVIEAKSVQGLGLTATILLRSGTLSIGSIIGTPDAVCKVRKLSGPCRVASPSQAVEVSGWKSLPSIGSRVSYIGEKEKLESYDDIKSALSSLNLYDKEVISNRIDPNCLCLKLMLFCDVSGSIEPVSRVINELGRNPKVKVQILRTSIGHPTQWDVEYAKLVEAIIIVFNIPENVKISELASISKQKMFSFNVVYNLADKIKVLMEALLPPITIETKLASARVKQLFNITLAKSKGGDGLVAGCLIEDGIMKMTPPNPIRIRRMGELVYSGKIKELRMHKDIVTSVSRGNECGILLDPAFDELQPGDEIHQVSLKQAKDKLELD